MNIKLNINSNLKEELVKEKLKKVLFLSTLKLHELAVINAPVDTGRLKNSIIIEPTFFGATKYDVFDGVDYGIHQEYGTFKMAAHPFMRPALIQVKNIWVKRFIEKELGKQ